MKLILDICFTNLTWTLQRYSSEIHIALYQETEYLLSIFRESEIPVVVQEVTALCFHSAVLHEVFTQKFYSLLFLEKIISWGITKCCFSNFITFFIFWLLYTHRYLIRFLWIYFLLLKKKPCIFSSSFMICVSSHFMPPACLDTKYQNLFIFWFMSFQSLGNSLNFFYRTLNH